MKQVLIFLMFLVFVNFVKAQVAELPTVNAISAYSVTTAKTLFIKDTIRGGQFTLYAGKDAADNGMIFTDALGQKWKRVTTAGEPINVQWYGARGYVLSSPFDSRPAFISARDYIYSHSAFNILYIPPDTTGLSGWSGGGRYYLSDSILFDKVITIQGEGQLFSPTSKVFFSPNTTGFVFKYALGGVSFPVTIKNLQIDGSTDASYYDITKHGITSSVITHIENVSVNSFGGDGLHISACAGPPSGDNNNYGNSDLSSITNFTSTFCTNGIFLEGCDANTIVITNSNTNQQRRWGIYDNGLLGNAYIKPHTAFCGAPAIAGANAVVTYLGKYYAARPGYDGYFGDAADSNYNKPPSDSTNYWYQVGGMSAVAWNNHTRYYSGGPICIRNANAWSNIFNAYTEGSQPPIYLNSRSKVDGGDNGAGVEAGSYHQVLFGADYFRNANQVLPNYRNTQHLLTIGKEDIDYASVISIYNDNSKSGTFLGVKSESSSNQIYSQYKTNTKSGIFGLSPTGFDTYDGSTLLSKLNTSGLFPGTDNTYDFGASGTAWKDIYAKLSSGVGTKAVRVDPSTGKFTYADTISAGSGTYTPTLSNITNIKSSTPIVCHYTRIGNQVTVTGSLGVVTTLAVATVVGISLPVSSNFRATTDAAGIGNASTAIGVNCVLEANSTKDVIELKFLGLSAGGSGTIFFSFTYTII